MVRSLKFALVMSCGLAAVAANAASDAQASKAKQPFADLDHVIYSTARGVEKPSVSLLANLTNHGGPVITGAARVVYIFWGPSFASGGADNGYATTLQAYRNQFGTTGEYNTITQYSGIPLTSLGAGTADWFDTSTPPANVTDAKVQAEVNLYLTTHTFNANTIYEVVIPSTSYSSSGSSTSCGGPSLAYCAYHGWIGSGSSAKKYSIQPWPGCSGCKVSGWSNVQNQEHFVCHETREAVTDPTGQGWWDSSGNEADDKCAWTPTPFIGTGGYAYQYEWSNATSSCVKTR
jgi:hypothetical protein